MNGDVAFGARLRRARKTLRLTQSQFAQRCGVQKRAQINYEQGFRAPGAEYLTRAAALGIRIDRLLSERPDLKPHLRRINGVWIQTQRRTP